MLNKKPKKIEYQTALKSSFEQAQGIKGWNIRYIPKNTGAIDESSLSIKIIAFYLPQFHPIPENDHWWGKGFTEWTNVTKAVPQFLGHYQPHLPGELGFYDLRLVDSIRAQAELARHYGIHGFCFHHYWFGGRRLLEKPLNILLENKDIKINFCLCWANENWSRRWDGLEDDILLSQSHSAEDDIAFIDSIIPAFNDERYIKIEGKPLLVVYRVTLLPDPKATAIRWRQRVKEMGFPDVHLVAATSFEISDASEYGFDATVEFPPHKLKPNPINEKFTILNPEYKGKIYDYEIWRTKWNSQGKGIHYRGVMPSWDNEPRRPGGGFTFVNASSASYADWLDKVCDETVKKDESERIVFINAWNEWAEGAHLEPDRKNGYAYLHATGSVLQRYSKPSAISNKISILQQRFKKKSDTCVIIHLFYTELSEDIIQRIKLMDNIDVHLSIMQNTSSEIIELWEKSHLNIYPTIVENRGRDIKSFLTGYNEFLRGKKYIYFCKIHTKKSLHRNDGDDWRSLIYSSILNNDAIEKLRKNEEIGLIAPAKAIMDLSEPVIHLGNMEWLNSLLEIFGASAMSDGYKFKFVAGSMFWGRVDAFNSLIKVKEIIDSFEIELGQLDGTLAHAFERIFGLIVGIAGYKILEMDDVTL